MKVLKMMMVSFTVNMQVNQYSAETPNESDINFKLCNNNYIIL